MKGVWQIRYGDLSFSFPDDGPMGEQHLLELLRELGKPHSDGRQVQVVYLPAMNRVEPEKEFNAWGERVR